MSNKLFVGGLSFQTAEDQLVEVFSQYGRLQSARIITDRETGRSRGFGFVEMSSPDEVDAAIENLDGTELDGREISVKVAHEKERRSFGHSNNRGGRGGRGGPRENMGNRW